MLNFAVFVSCSKVLKERAIIAAGKLALDCVSQFIEDAPHGRHNRHERSLQDVVIGARACAYIILSSAQCRYNLYAGNSSLENVISLLPFFAFALVSQKPVIRRRYSHQLIQGLCSLIHQGRPVSAAAILVIHGIRNRLERVSKEMDLLFTMHDERTLNVALFGRLDPTKLKELYDVPSWFVTNAFLVCHYNESVQMESLFHQSMNVYLFFL